MNKAKYSTFFLIFAFSLSISAQLPPPPPPPVVAGLPINGGVLLLLISGVIYGVNKLRK